MERRFGVWTDQCDFGRAVTGEQAGRLRFSSFSRSLREYCLILCASSYWERGRPRPQMSAKRELCLSSIVLKTSDAGEGARAPSKAAPFACSEPFHHLFYFFRVRAAFFAARERDAADLFLAALRAWRESARFEAALRPSRIKACEVARERLADFLALFFFPLATSRAACLRV